MFVERNLLQQGLISEKVSVRSNQIPYENPRFILQIDEVDQSRLDGSSNSDCNPHIWIYWS